MKVVEFPTAKGSTHREQSVSVSTLNCTGFDYADVDSGTADRLKQAAEEIRACQRRESRSIVEIGIKLIRVKTSLDHGHFGSWLKQEFKWSGRTAQNYMRTAEVFETKSETVADLPASLIYKLAAPSTPKEIREKVIADLEAGNRIDCLHAIDEIRRSRAWTLPKKVRRVEKATLEADAILAKLSVADADRLLNRLRIPGVADRLGDGSNYRWAKPR